LSAAGVVAGLAAVADADAVAPLAAGLAPAGLAAGLRRAAGLAPAGLVAPGLAAVADFAVAAGLAAVAVAAGLAAAGLGFARGAGLRVVPGLGLLAVDAVLVDERGARGSPAAGAPTERGPADVVRRAVVVAAGVAGVAGVVGASSFVSWLPGRRRLASPAPADTAPRPIPTMESMMFFGLMAMQ
jgi:hypothetical protein